MLKTLALAALLAAGLCATASAQAFLGQWTATAQAPGGDTREVITASKTATGYSVTGQAPVDTMSPGKDVVLDGNNFAFKRSLTVQGAKLEIDYNGVVSDDTFTGTAEVAGMQIPTPGSGSRAANNRDRIRSRVRRRPSLEAGR